MNPLEIHETDPSPAARVRRRAVALSAVVLALTASLLVPVSASAQQDGGAADPQLVAAVRGYAAETEKGYDHVLRWMRVLKTLGGVEGMTAC